MERGVTPSQTIGPFFAIMVPLGGNELVPPGTAGAIVVEGRVLDGAGEPVNDALVETGHRPRLDGHEREAPLSVGSAAPEPAE